MIKKIILGFSLFLTCVLPSFVNAQISGKVIRERDAGMFFYYLLTPDNKKIFLGAPYEVDNPKKICVEDGFDNDKTIYLEGKVAKNEGEESFSFVTDFQCTDPPSRNQTAKTRNENPTIKGLSLSQSFEQAENIVRNFGLKPDNTSDHPGVMIRRMPHGFDYNMIRGFGFYNNGIRDLFNSDKLDKEFLNKFMQAYNIKGNQVDYKTFTKKFLTDFERDSDTFDVIQPIPVFDTSDRITGNTTYFIDCGKFAIIVAFDNPSQKGYLGITRQVAEPQPEKVRPKGLQFN